VVKMEKYDRRKNNIPKTLKNLTIFRSFPGLDAVYLKDDDLVFIKEKKEHFKFRSKVWEIKHGDLLPPLKRRASPFNEGYRLLQGLEFGAVHPYGPMGAQARPSMSQRVPPHFGSGHRQAGPQPGLQLTRPHGGRLSEHVFIIAYSDLKCPPLADVGESMYPLIEIGGFIAPPHPLFFL